METLSWKIDGMRCAGCAKIIKARLMREPGVLRAEVEFPTRSARILLDPATASPGALASLLERAGYRVIVEQKT